ncbi:phosphatidate cytidylyltransferase [Dokdonia sp. Hel_I_53]|uniref:phosphatidate cytidylyltransferase n=1 Tax=Dokdonia sp. Hel_I_53 TaxID=1566287 RepID=UPI00119A3B69|nr:phosphatidate cytidylyltransferase [Dokdonia sp. Hel_I_53]TVZ52090.1 phosphatidate cytidylyltransferase [Dokdonia sp. Hel_I_53]
MREVVIRALSGLLYVTLLLLAIFSLETTYLVVFSVLGIAVLYEFLKLIGIKSILPYLLLLVCIAGLCYFKFERMVTIVFLALTITVNLYLIKNLIRPSERYITVSQKYAYTIFYIIGGVVFTILLPSYKGEYTSLLVASVFALIWINDTFAFIVGKSIGKRKLLERISPKKTIEGFVGGLVFCCIASIIFSAFTDLLSIQLWLTVAVVTSVFGTLGDLIQSQLKRQAGVKDSGRIMPGHGGLFDRLDSIIFAAPFLYLFLIVLDYVP